MSFYVAYIHPGLGQRKSSNFAEEADAQAYRDGQPPEWKGGIVWTPQPPEIFRHCGPSSLPAQAIGGKCFHCGKILTQADAKAYRGAK